MQQAFERLIRFADKDGNILYGDIPLGVDTKRIQGSAVTVIEGNILNGFSRTSKEATVAKLLCPLPAVPIMPCVGLNYQHHATEANMKVPKFPVIFTKPSDALAGPCEDIHIHPEVQQQMDYEGELTVVMRKDAKNVTEEEALEYVLGYTCGNDLSARDFQIPAEIVGSQYCYAKSFDQFGPIGPTIVAASMIPDPQALTYKTRVNGEVRQKTSTSDMIHSVRKIIAHLSRGTTLRAGTCIMTGTPSGVGLWMKPQVFLKDGDIIEVDCEKIGVLENKVVFDQ